ncbi:MAG: AAA family ATPase, partial [Rhodospirillales bacterium]|nr:AAA family ATPase [Rhodospirillales bacterium]
HLGGIGYGNGKGRMANRIPRRDASFFLEPWIPANVLTFVVGNPSAGKSTFGAWLCAQANRPAVMPGIEEDVECATMPRFALAQVALERCLVLDDRPWHLPYDRQALTDLLWSHGCDLVWVDPIDSYVNITHESDPTAVRDALEAFARVARDVPCSIVAARHPGKDPNNLCPGSRHWRAVPREIVELRYDEGPPVKRIMRLRKDPYSRAPSPVQYSLAGVAGEPKLFVMGNSVGIAEADTLGLADPLSRWKVDEAVDFLQDVLADAPLPRAVVFSLAEKERLAEGTLRYAARRIGVVISRSGKGIEHHSTWELPSTPSTPST